MSGIKNLFHQYNQELMEFTPPSMVSPMGMTPMMGYSSMMMKPGSKPFNPWDPNANKDKDKDKKKDNFWKWLLGLGAVGGLGLGGAYLYNQHQKNSGLKGQASKFAGNMLNLHGEDAMSMLFNGAQQHMAHQQNVQNHRDLWTTVNDLADQKAKNATTHSNTNQTNP